MASMDPRRPPRSSTLPLLFALALGGTIAAALLGRSSSLLATDFTLSTRATTIEYSALLGQGSGEVMIQLREDHSAGSPLSFVGGVSFSFSNDPTVIKPTSLTPSGILLLLNGGAGPEIADVQLFSDGAVAGWIFDLGGGSDVLFPGDLEIATLTIATIESSWAGDPTGDSVILSDQTPPSLAATVEDIVWVEGVSQPAEWEMAPIVFVPGPRGFLRGDANQDGAVEGIPDAIKLLAGLFNPAVELGCLGAADINDDSLVDLGDAIFLLNWTFGPNGPPPPPPFPACGTDPTADALDCLEPTC